MRKPLRAGHITQKRGKDLFAVTKVNARKVGLINLHGYPHQLIISNNIILGSVAQEN